MGSNPVGRAIVFNHLALSRSSHVFYWGTLWGTIALSGATGDDSAVLHGCRSDGTGAAFMAPLRARKSTMALEFCILTASRSSEVLNAEWSEFDLEKKIWTIPAHRMKAGHAHRIPLTDRAGNSQGLPKLDRNPHVFPGMPGKPLSGMAMTMQLRRMKRENITVHGFRSTFRDWASEQTSFPHETCEHALAHRISDKAEAAYRRGDQFEKRRKLMEAWAAFCEPAPRDNVVTLRKTERDRTRRARPTGRTGMHAARSRVIATKR